MRKMIALVLVLFLCGFAYAQGAGIEEITEPIERIYELIRGVVSILGVIAITVAGALYMFSGGNIQSRESAKMMVSYAIVGLVLVWVAPLIVDYLTVM